jgi:hypothetical protein
VVKQEGAKRGFVLLPRRWVVERDFAWASRFRRSVKDYERPPETVGGLHFVAFACLFPSAGDRHPPHGFITRSRSVLLASAYVIYAVGTALALISLSLVFVADVLWEQ